ncbi:MAG: S-layer homology domain-containing protein [Eubacteriales bacterium]|nr:S-layer homology domain-containing protein [Eubacteriales bacterium]
MKKIISGLLTAALVMALFSGTAFAGNGNGNGKNKEFKDLKGHWGKQSVEKMQNLGILNGYADGSFQPDRTLTQAELAVIIERILELKGDKDDFQWIEDDDDDKDYSDIPKWAQKAVKKGIHKNYFNIKRFHSHVQVDRLTACVSIAKALELEPVTDFEMNPFKDLGMLNDEDFGYLLALYEEGYIKGYPNGTFNPYSLLSRAQMAAIIENLLDQQADEDSDDETAPAWASDSTVTATAIRATAVELKWSAATDDEGVVGYKVSYELDRVDKVKYVSERTVTISGLEADEGYTFTVEAKDAAGNWSDDGPSVEVITLEEEAADTSVPIWPSGAALTVSPSVSGVVTLVWPDAEDNEGVASYKVYQNSVLIYTMEKDANSVNVSGLSTDTEYVFKVRAFDAAGNMSTSLSKTHLTD